MEEEKQQRHLGEGWNVRMTLDLRGMSTFEKREADLDVRGKNVLAASAPQNLTDIAVDALDQRLLSLQRRRQPQQQQSPIPSVILTTVFRSPLLRDRNFRTKFARADRLDPQKAAARLVAYLSKSIELFGQVALTRPVRTSDILQTDEQALRNGWIQFLLTRDSTGRRILALDDLGPTDIPLESKVCCRGDAFRLVFIVVLLFVLTILNFLRFHRHTR
jgi:hypothetical protein